MQSTDEPRRIVRCYDPAIDYLRTRWRDYVARRRFADLTLRGTPVIFHVRLLDDDAVRATARFAEDESRAECAFRYAVIRVENKPDRPHPDAAEDAPLVRCTWESKDPIIGGAQAPMKPDDAKLFAWVDRVEIGRVALEQSTLPFDLPYAAPFQLLPTSGRILGQILDLLAAELRASAMETSTEKQPSASPDIPSTPQVSAPPTDATAAADAT